LYECELKAVYHWSFGMDEVGVPEHGESL